MTLRITQGLYERLQWAISVRPDLSMSDVIRMAMNSRVLTGVAMTGDDAGQIVLNVDFRGLNDGLEPAEIRRIIAGYLSMQKAKIESRRHVPLDLDPCANYTVENIQ